MHTGWVVKVPDGVCVFHGELEPAARDEVDALMTLLSNYMKTCLNTADEEPV